MKNSRRALAIFSFAMATAFAGPAVAQDVGWYVGGAIGQSDAKDGCTAVAGTGISCDKKDSAFKIFGGYQVNRNFAAELAYTDLGKVNLTFAGLTETIESTAFEIAAVGSVPLANQFSIFGRLGLYRSDTEDRTNFGFSADDSNTGLTFGFGVRYDFTRNIAVRAEWQRYSDVGSDTIGESDVDVLSIGVIFKF